MLDNFLAFLSIWTTPAESAPGTANTVTIKTARWAAGGWLVVGVLIGPRVHEAIGMRPLI